MLGGWWMGATKNKLFRKTRMKIGCLYFKRQRLDAFRSGILTINIRVYKFAAYFAGLRDKVNFFPRVTYLFKSKTNELLAWALFLFTSSPTEKKKKLKTNKSLKHSPLLNRVQYSQSVFTEYTRKVTSQIRRSVVIFFYVSSSLSSL